jgi:hypothetical protein
MPAVRTPVDPTGSEAAAEVSGYALQEPVLAQGEEEGMRMALPVGPVAGKDGWVVVWRSPFPVSQLYQRSLLAFARTKHQARMEKEAIEKEYATLIHAGVGRLVIARLAEEKA